MKADHQRLEQAVAELLAKSPIKSSFGGFVVEEDTDLDGMEFLRIGFPLKKDPPNGDADLLSFIKYVKNSLSPVDERFVSVRFPDPS